MSTSLHLTMNDLEHDCPRITLVVSGCVRRFHRSGMQVIVLGRTPTWRQAERTKKNHKDFRCPGNRPRRYITREIDGAELYKKRVVDVSSPHSKLRLEPSLFTSLKMVNSVAIVLAAMLSTVSAATTCSPPAASGVSINSTMLSNGVDGPAGPYEITAIPSNPSTFAPQVLWVSPLSTGPWTLTPDGDLYLLTHSEFPGLFLTSIFSATVLEMDTRQASDALLNLQLFNITCTTCPSDGFANDCTFSNLPLPKSSGQNTLNCILNQRNAALGNETYTDECNSGVAAYSLKLDYHL
ncbi:hypothetical protein MSAN_01126500 [Mycena sanguinolenta]|uniref:Uncharacterized protein n=1 Tax=Mycena sanguinolenta TaxID=230812 RepID=A0A8H6YMD9_9AGAR|nr:hypothetical protein MSAN_01126500 [Mycena sanguinolenta]